MPEVRYIGEARVSGLYRRPDGRVVVTFRRSADGTCRDPAVFGTLDAYLAAVRREWRPPGLGNAVAPRQRKDNER